MYANKNNIRSELTSNVGVLDTSISITSGEGILRESNMIACLEHFDGDVCTKREIVKITAINDDVFTVERGFAECIMNDETMQQGQGSQEFVSGDYLSLYLSKELRESGIGTKVEDYDTCLDVVQSNITTIKNCIDGCCNNRMQKVGLLNDAKYTNGGFGNGCDGDCVVSGNVFRCANKVYQFRNLTICANGCVRFEGQGVPQIKVHDHYVNNGVIDTRAGYIPTCNCTRTVNFGGGGTACGVHPNNANIVQYGGGTGGCNGKSEYCRCPGCYEGQCGCPGCAGSSTCGGKGGNGGASAQGCAGSTGGNPSGCNGGNGGAGASYGGRQYEGPGGGGGGGGGGGRFGNGGNGGTGGGGRVYASYTYQSQCCMGGGGNGGNSGLRGRGGQGGQAGSNSSVATGRRTLRSTGGNGGCGYCGGKGGTSYYYGSGSRAGDGGCGIYCGGEGGDTMASSSGSACQYQIAGNGGNAITNIYGLVVNARCVSGSGCIRACGGYGGKGGCGRCCGAGGCGGNGANGGQVIYAYTHGTPEKICVNGGSGGAGGCGDKSNGTAGTAGSAGRKIVYKVGFSPYITDFNLVNDATNEKIKISRKDPTTIPGSPQIRAKTVVRYSTTNYPATPTAGTLVVQETTKNQYAVNPYSFSANDNTTYYFSAFALDSNDTIIDVQTKNITTDFDRVPTTNTIGYRPLTSSTQLADKSGNSYNLTNSGVQFGTYVGVKCGYFNGSSRAYNSNVAKLMSGRQAFTTLLFCYFNSYASNNINSQLSMGNPGTTNQAQLTQQNNGKLARAYWGGSFKSDSVATGTRYHLVCVYDGTNYRFYINGTRKLSGSFTSLNLQGKTVSIGDRGNGGEYHNGYIHHVIIENKARTDTQVSTYYNKFKTKYIG